jgi:hypothetical protein
MQITQVTLPTSGQVLILEEFFAADILAELHTIVATFPDPTTWVPAPGFDEAFPRRHYEGGRDKIVVEWLNQPEQREPLEQATGHRLLCLGCNIWCDQTGVGPLLAHKERGGDSLAQLYITKQQDPFTGTTIYNDSGDLLFQLPFRDNFGWLFNTGADVMHGRVQDVPLGILRYSILVRFEHLAQVDQQIHK